MTFLWISHDFLMTFSWLSIDFCMTFSWLYLDFLMTFAWLSHDFLLTFSWLSHELLMTLSRILMNFWIGKRLCRFGPCLPLFTYLSEIRPIINIINIGSCWLQTITMPRRGLWDCLGLAWQIWPTRVVWAKQLSRNVPTPTYPCPAPTPHPTPLRWVCSWLTASSSYSPTLGPLGLDWGWFWGLGIRYLPILKIQFYCTACTVSCRCKQSVSGL